MSRAGGVLVLTSLVLLLVGNRWANYLISPIPGLYLVDALFALGALLSLGQLPVLLSTPRKFWWPFGILWCYVLGVLAPEYLLVSGDDKYDALRDAAPFIYLSLTPLVALGLLSLKGRVLVSTLRWAALGAAAIAVLTNLGILHPFSSPLLGSTFTEILSVRPDLLGAALGIGILSWGPWPPSQSRESLVTQGGLLFGGVIIIENRSGLIALLTAALIAIVREVRRSKRIAVPVAAFGLVLTGLAIQAVEFELGPSTTATTTPSTETATTTHQVEAWIPDRMLKLGTVRARLDTWMDIVNGMTRDGTWLVGGSAGSDYMYELCTGIPVAPDVILDDPKCAVDDSGPEPVVRDPHNWILNIVLYHGLIGLFIFGAVLVLPACWTRKTPNAALPIGGIVTYLTVGMTFLISAGYALIPIAFFVSWLYRNSLHQSNNQVGSDTR